MLGNESPMKEFQFHKGLRKGDPLSPYLSLLVMESLHISSSKAMHQGIFIVPISVLKNLESLRSNFFWGNVRGDHCWVWSLDLSGLFLVASAMKFIKEQLSICNGNPTRPIKFVPIKVNILAWRLASNKLPTRLNMSLRGLELPSIHRFNSNVKFTSHLFFACDVARDIRIY
ncbi:RNA-directed DNA polymerase, eukaryota [Tanacetum coccineum]